MATDDGAWSGYEDGDVHMDFGGTTFCVHREIVAHASPVWKAMLTGTFAEATGSTVHFDGDDPQVARLCIEIVHSTLADSSTLDWAEVESHVTADRAAFDLFVDKYDLRGVKRIVEYGLRTRQKTRHLEYNHQQFVNELNSGHSAEVERLEGEVQRLEGEVKRLAKEVKYMATKPGTPVNLDEYAPEIGTPVKWMIPTDLEEMDMDRKQRYKYKAVGRIIAIDGRSVTVRWRKSGGVKSYYPMRVGLGYA